MNRNLKRTSLCSAGLLGAAILATVVLAGGFGLRVELPPSSSEPLLKNAVLLVRAFDCGTPSDVKMSARAEGVVDGRRQSVPLRLRSVGEGVYALDRQWPTRGTWVLAFSGTLYRFTRTVIVEVQPDGNVAVRNAGGDRQIPFDIVDGEVSNQHLDAILARAETRGKTETGVAVGSR